MREHVVENNRELGGRLMVDLYADRDDITLEDAVLRIAALAWQYDDDIQLEGAADWGHFEGDLVVELLDDGRQCRVLRPYVFIRPDGSSWVVPPDTVVDGASIPRPFWSVIGGPFEGRYRNASVVHDRYCDTMERTWRDTHRMFYEAMRCKGVPSLKAKVMFYAVNRFGPRWPSPGEPVVEAPSAALLPRDEDARTILADAEAIFAHDLTVDEIQRLADARRLEPLVFEGPRGETDARHVARARSLVVCGGNGDFEDLEAVAAEAALLPDFVLSQFERKRIRIVACRESITDFESAYRGKVPRGWESTGKTWDVVPGTYFQEKLRVVISTVGTPSGGRQVPTRSSGRHGSEHLVVHESLHGYDYSGGHAVLAEDRFVEARDLDLDRLEGAMNGYLVQPGQPGLEETYAESGARFAADEVAMSAAWPNLHGYWSAGPAVRAEGVHSPGLESPVGANAPLGFATIDPGGGITLDLRAEGSGGAIGHAMIDISPGEDAYAAVVEQLLGAEPLPESAVPVRLPFYARAADSPVGN
jgi:hypothetical protein